MPNNISGSSSSGQFLETCCRQAIVCLDQASDLPCEALISKVEEAEGMVVKLRDGLIEWLRQETASGVASQWRRPLDQVNMCLSLIAGVAFPGTQVQREYVGDAHQALVDVCAQLRRPG